MATVVVGSLGATAAHSAPPAGDPTTDITTLASSAGCGSAPTLSSGTHTIQVGGTNRSFILRVPDNYDSSRAYPLIFGFHWNGGTAGDVSGGGSDGESQAASAPRLIPTSAKWVMLMKDPSQEPGAP